MMELRVAGDQSCASCNNEDECNSFTLSTDLLLEVKILVIIAVDWNLNTLHTDRLLPLSDLQEIEMWHQTPLVPSRPDSSQ